MPKNPINNRQLKFIDLFCGAGFGARGAVMAGAKPVFAVDLWEKATETYFLNFPDADVRTSRIEDIDPKKLAKEKQFQVDVILTTPECTSHSIARGAKPGCEKSKETSINSLKWIDAFKPEWVIFENVRRMKSWDRHSELMERLEKDYAVSELFLNAKDYGTPQARKRMFLVCSRQGIRLQESDLHRVGRRRNITARSIIDWKSKDYKSKPLKSPTRAKATLERAERAIEALGEGNDFLIVYYGSDYAGGWQSLDAPLRTVTTLDRFGLVTWQNDVPYLRMLQPKELLKAMGARNHKLAEVNRRDKIKLCGNGVCSPVMESLFKTIQKHHFK